MQIHPIKFECTQCGKCCERQFAGAPLYIRDVESLSAYLRLTPAAFVERYCSIEMEDVEVDGQTVRVTGLRLRSNEGRCVFLKGKLCGVHDAKPYICKASPFVSQVFTFPDLENELRIVCDGYGQGKTYSSEEIRAWIEVEQEHEAADVERHLAGGLEQLGIVSGADTKPKEQ